MDLEIIAQQGCPRYLTPVATFSIHSDPARQRITVTWEGVITEQDIAAAMVEVAAAMQPGFDLIGDMRRAVVDVIMRSSSKLETQRIERRFVHPTAVVVQDQVSYASFMQYTMLNEARGGGEMGVFYTFADAEGWLDGLRAGNVGTKAVSA
jgi:hypothetical protein